MSLAADIRTYLITQGYTNVFAGYLPETPDSAINISEYAGREPSRTLDGKYSKRPSVQIIVRDPDYNTAKDRIEDIFELLDSTVNTIIGSSSIISIFAIQSPFPTGRDEKNRSLFVVNFKTETKG